MDEETNATDPLGVTPSAALEQAAPVRDPLGAGRALLLFLLYLAGQVIIGIGMGIILIAVDGPDRADGFSPEILLCGALAGILIGLWLVLRFAMRWSPDPDHSLAALDIGWASGTRKQLVVSGSAGALIAILYLVSLRWLTARWHAPELGPTVHAAFHSRFTFALWAALAVLIAPPIEELLFRGLMLRGMSRSWGPFAAGLGVTTLFVASHWFETGLYLPALMAIAALGCGTLAARAATGALGPAVALHAGYNATITLVAALLRA